MEKNCLVTTYKAAVNDNSLLKIGEMRLEAGTFTETYGKRINFTSYPQVIETLDGSASLTTDKNLLTGFTNKITLNTDNQFFYTKTQDVVIVVSNKYDVKGIYCRKTTINLDNLKYSDNLASLEDVFCKGSLASIKDKPITYLMNLEFEKKQDIINLSGLTALTNLSMGNTSVSGDISALSGLTALTFINFGNASVSGNIQSLGTLTALTFMELVNMPNMRGEVIDYVIAQRSHGRTSGNTRFGPSRTVKFNGKVLSGYNNFSWTASTITNETTSETVNR